MFKSTSKHLKYWQERQLDWKKFYLATWNHPHRQFIIQVLKTFIWQSLWEVGCGPGPNLVKICQTFPEKQLGGNDVNADAIKLASETFKGGVFEVSPGNDIIMSDGATDVVLSDMCLLYVDPFKIDSYLKEMKRICRRRLILVELHSDSWWERFKLRWGGYHAYNYFRRLEKIGFYDIMIWKIPKESWNGAPQDKFAYLISAKP